MSNDQMLFGQPLPYVQSICKTFRPLSFLHHSTFGVRYSAVLFRSYRLRQPNNVFRTPSPLYCCQSTNLKLSNLKPQTSLFHDRLVSGGEIVRDRSGALAGSNPLDATAEQCLETDTLHGFQAADMSQ